MYDYKAANGDEMTFQKGQLINVLNKDNSDWWRGELNGLTGLFPTNYVKMTTESDPSQQCKSAHFYILHSEWNRKRVKCPCMDLCKFKKHCNNKKINGAKLLNDESKDLKKSKHWKSKERSEMYQHPATC